MKKNEVKVKQTYIAKVSDRLVPVRIDSVHSRQGWNATNTKTGRRVHIKSAQRLRRPAGSSKAPAGGSKPKAAAAKAKAKDDATPPAKTAAKTATKAAVAKAAKPARTGRRRTPDSPGGVAMTVFRNQAVVDKAIAKAAKRPATKSAKPKDAKPKRVSALDAAATALRTLGKPANCKTLIAIMADQGLWTSPNGKTPAATLYAAILREIKAKGDAARFRKVERGQFELAAKEG